MLDFSFVCHWISYLAFTIHFSPGTLDFYHFLIQRDALIPSCEKCPQLSCISYFQSLRTIKWSWTKWKSFLNSRSRWIRVQCNSTEGSHYQPTPWVPQTFDGNTRVCERWGQDKRNIAKHWDRFYRSGSNSVSMGRCRNGDACGWQSHSASSNCYSTSTFPVSNTTATTDPTSIPSSSTIIISTSIQILYPS